MERTKAANNAASLPVYTPGVEAAGFYQDTPAGTLVTAAAMNGIQEELIGMQAELGLSPVGDPSSPQIGPAIHGVRGIKSAATGTGILATATVDEIAVVASDSGAVGAGALRAAVIGCELAQIGVAAENAVVLASEEDPAVGSLLINNGENAAIVASRAQPGNSCAIPTGFTETAIVASADVLLTGTGAGVLVAGCIGAGGGAADVAGGAIIGSRDSEIVGGPTAIATVVLAANNVTAVGGGDDFSVVGGHGVGPPSAANKTWALRGVGGVGVFEGGTTAGPADLAELFENVAPGVLEVGRLVTRKGRKVKTAGPGDRVLGVVSAAPAFLGNDAPFAWHGRYKRDQWSRVIRDKQGRPRTSTAYKPQGAAEYLPRSKRPAEWTPVALVGQVRIAVAKGVKVDDYLEAGADGLGVAAAGETRIEVMEIEAKHTAARGYGVALCLVR